MGRFHEPDELDAEPRADLVEVRPSKIPGAGLGLFAKVEIPADTYLGEYTGRYVTDAELRALAEVDNAYLFHIPECAATPYDGIAGDSAHYISKVNYAPAEVRGEDTYLQNVDWQVFCDAPYVQLHAIRDIEAGQELYVDYGLDYGYDFMERPEVQRFFLEVLGEDPDAEFVYEYTVP